MSGSQSVSGFATWSTHLVPPHAITPLPPDHRLYAHARLAAAERVVEVGLTSRPAPLGWEHTGCTPMPGNRDLRCSCCHAEWCEASYG